MYGHHPKYRSKVTIFSGGQVIVIAILCRGARVLKRRRSGNKYLAHSAVQSRHFFLNKINCIAAAWADFEKSRVSEKKYCLLAIIEISIKNLYEAW
jgi:hypothetical protein